MVPRKRVLDLVRKHDSWRRKECINLIPSENVVSPIVKEILASDVGNRYTLPVKAVVHGELVENAYCGTKYVDELEAFAERLACEIFHARYACFKPLSGHLAALTMLIALCRPGNTILTVDVEMGGYDGYLPNYMPEILGLKSVVLPHKGFELDYDASRELIRRRRPRLVVLGASIIPFPFNIRSIRDACDAVGAWIGYDASHVSGLIAGEKFQQPLTEGADIIVSSTHKTIFGPQGGMVLTNDESLYRRVLDSLTWKTLDNAHWNRIAAMAYVLQELREFGRDYAGEVVKNAKVLAEALDSKGVPVMFRDRGYTESHQVLVNTSAIAELTDESYPRIARRLERANLIVDSIGRLGTQEVTRCGMQEGEMRTIAGFISRVVKGEDPELVRKDVSDLRRDFLEVRYTFQDSVN